MLSRSRPRNRRRRQRAAPARPTGPTETARARSGRGQSQGQDQGRGKTKSRVRRDPPGFYMGRRIADVMSWQGADWLFRETRIEEEQPEAMLDALKIPAAPPSPTSARAPAITASAWLAASGPTAPSWPPTSSPRCSQMLRENAAKAGVTNIKPLRATQTDTKLPDGAVDLILMVDVYHECSDPETLLQGLRKALKPRGRLVLVEFRGEDPEVPIKPEHKMTLEQVRREVEPQGFIFKKSLEFLPWQHVIIFEKPGDEPPKPKTENAQK